MSTSTPAFLARLPSSPEHTVSLQGGEPEPVPPVSPMVLLLERATRSVSHDDCVCCSKLHLFSKHSYYTCTHAHERVLPSAAQGQSTILADCSADLYSTSHTCACTWLRAPPRLTYNTAVSAPRPHTEREGGRGGKAAEQASYHSSSDAPRRKNCNLES